MLRNTREAVNMGLTRDIVSKASRDQSFRERLLKDPKAAIQTEFGVEFPQNVTVRVHENTGTIFNLVLPEPVEVSSQRDLTPEQLQQVAGGKAGTFGGVSNCCTATGLFKCPPKPQKPTPL
jgi:hypothetical protein